MKLEMIKIDYNVVTGQKIVSVPMPVEELSKAQRIENTRIHNAVRCIKCISQRNRNFGRETPGNSR